jgi:DNA-binding NarL/FixJ family response regulator
VLALMAQGHGNAHIAARLVVTERAVHKRIRNIFAKLGLHPADSSDRRVMASCATSSTGFNRAGREFSPSVAQWWVGEANGT